MNIARILASSVASLLLVQSASAASGVWSSVAATGDWGVPGNWADNIANGADSTADFNQVNVPVGGIAVSLDQARTIGNLIFGDTTTATSGGWTVANGGNAANILTLSAAATPVITVNALGGSNNATISTELAGSQGLTKAGAGVLVLAGTNSYTGGTTINAGFLRFGTTSTVPATGAVTISGNGVLVAAGPTNFSTAAEWLNSNRIAPASNGILGINTNVSAALDFTNTPNLYLGATTTVTYSGALTQPSGYRLGGNSPLTVSSNLGGSQGLKVGATSILTLTGDNSYAGLTEIPSSGTLRITSSNALGTGAQGVMISSGGKLEISGGINVAAEPIRIVGATGQGSLINTANDNIWGGPVTIGSDGARVGTLGGRLDIRGVIDDGADTFKFAIRSGDAPPAGSGIRLSAVNTYGGGTDLVVGLLQIGIDNALPKTTLTMSSTGGISTATFDLLGHRQAVTSIIAAGNPATGNPSRVINSDANVAGAITLEMIAAANLSTGTGANAVVYGGAGANNFSLTKTGAANSNYTINTAGTYSGGTSIEGGTLTVSLAGSLGTGNVTVTGSAVKLTITTGVADAIANTALLSLAGGGVASTADAGFLQFAGPETVGGLILGGVLMPQGTYGATGSGAENIRDDFFSGAGVLTNNATAIPEPGSLLSITVGLGLLAGVRRRRNLLS